jgi:hypothetical protein
MQDGIQDILSVFRLTDSALQVFKLGRQPSFRHSECLTELDSRVRNYTVTFTGSHLAHSALQSEEAKCLAKICTAHFLLTDIMLPDFF